MSGEVVNRDGQEYQAVTLNVNGVTKRVFVPLSDESDNFIPTPDNPQPKPTAVHTARKEAPVIRKTTPIVVNNVGLSNAPTASSFAMKDVGIAIAPKPVAQQPLQIVPNLGASPQVIRLGMAPAAPLVNVANTIPASTVVNGRQVQLQLQNQQGGITTPVSSVGVNLVNNPSAAGINNIRVPFPITVNTAGPSTVIQAGTLIRPNSANTGNTVQLGNVILPSPVGRPPATNQFPQQQVFKLDGSGRLQLVNPTPKVNTVATALQNSRQLQPPKANTVAAALQNSRELHQPRPQLQMQQPSSLTLSTPDGKVFTVPNHLLPTTIASAITPVAQPQVLTNRPLQLTPGGSVNFIQQPVAQANKGQSNFAVGQLTMPVVSTGNLQSVSHSVTSPTSSIGQPVQNGNFNSGPFAPIAPKLGIPMGVATIMPNKFAEQTVTKKDSQSMIVDVDLCDELKNSIQEHKDAAHRFTMSPKAKYKKEDKPYRPPQNVYFSSKAHDELITNRRRSSRIKTKPCSVVMKRLNIKRNTTVNLNEIPIRLLD